MRRSWWTSPWTAGWAAGRLGKTRGGRMGVWVLLAALFLSPRCASPLEMFADITTDTVTEFGIYRPCLVDVTPAAATYTIAPDFSNVVNFDQFTSFTDEEKRLLRENGFVASPLLITRNRWDPNRFISRYFLEMFDVYNCALDNDLPIFVTVDALLHTYHELYDYALRTIESERFCRDLEDLTTAMIVASRTQYEAATDPAVLDAALRNVAYFTVAARLLNSSATVAADVAVTVTAELALIDAHAGPDASPLFGYVEDYSQYIPRGHYTLSEQLSRYFRAMMWYGRMVFHAEPVTSPGVREETRRALLITQLTDTIDVSTETAQVVWERIYQPTTFFVGKADDLTFHQYAQIARTIYGTDLGSVAVDDFADEAKLTQFLEAVEALPPPRIAVDEWGKGFRFMGQRFIPDSYMFENLVLPHVPARTLPRGLDVMAVLGSQRAYEILDQVYHDTSLTSYSAQITALGAEFAAMDDAVWAQNLYWNWLYCLMPMLAPKGPGFPTYMQNPAWTDKELSGALGSWAELRHDTILYAKQSGSVGLLDYAFRKAFVEANPWAFARLAALTRLMIDGLGGQGLLLEEFGGRLVDLEDLLLSLERMAEKELTNQPLTAEECKIVRTIGRRLAELTIFEPLGDIVMDDDMAVIADVHSDYVSGNCLEVGVGRPLTLFVINKSGDDLVVALGSAFSYYEFAWPLTDRLTDEAWRQMLSGDTPPTLPEWIGSYIDVAADFNARQPRNVGPPYRTGSSMTLTVFAVPARPAVRYRVHAVLAYWDSLSSLTLEAVCGRHRKEISLPLVAEDPMGRKEYEGILDLQGWPSGEVSATAYCPQNIAIIKTVTFHHTGETAVSPRRWRLY